jgi:hypothetical protein
MNMHERFALSQEFATAPTWPRWLGSMPAKLGAWMKDCADHYAAATAYEYLSRLSDAELKHRGLGRDILARDLSAWGAHRARGADDTC